MPEIDTKNQTVDACLLITALPDEDSAGRLAAALLEQRLVACVNCVPGVSSHYRWQGAVRNDREVLVLLKTRQSLAAAATAAIRHAHPYELPEVLTVPVIGGLAGYLDWLQHETAQEA